MISILVFSLLKKICQCKTTASFLTSKKNSGRFLPYHLYRVHTKSITFTYSTSIFLCNWRHEKGFPFPIPRLAAFHSACLAFSGGFYRRSVALFSVQRRRSSSGLIICFRNYGILITKIKYAQLFFAQAIAVLARK